MDLIAAENRWRARGLLYGSLVLSALLVLFAWVNFSMGLGPDSWVSLAGVPCMAATAYGASRRPRMPEWAPYPAFCYLALLFFLVLFVAPVEGGPALMWFCAVPPLCTFALRARAGLAFSLAIFGVLLYALSETEHLLSEAYAVRLCMAYGLITLFTFLYEFHRERVTRRYVEAQNRIATLEGLLSICGWCHRRMKDEDGRWVSTEQFFQDRAPVEFSHGLCPECSRQLMEAKVDA